MKIRVGTRGSKMALVQTELVIDELKKSFPDLEAEIVVLKTAGDKRQGTADAAVVDKRKWMHELELAILNGEIDVSCNSAKDMPAEVAEETLVVSALKRSDRRDAIILNYAKEFSSFSEIPDDAIIGTSSLRRRAQILYKNQSINLIDFRGNINTRISKLKSSDEVYGIVVAAAGLERLGVSREQYHLIPLEEMLPAVNQGALALQYLAKRDDLTEIFSKIQNSDSQREFIAERICVQNLGAGCHSAIGINAVSTAEETKLKASVFSRDGQSIINSEKTLQKGMELELGMEVAKELLEHGAAKLLCD